MVQRIIGEIPARYGSKRVKHKNLRLLHGKPLICYAIEAAKQTKLLTEVYVNSESDIIGQLAIDNGIKFYKREARLSTDKSTSDEFNYDFIKGTNADVLVMINPVSPLIEGIDIDNAVRFYKNHNYDTVISIREEYLQTFYKNKPINFNPKGMLPRTQDISPIQICVWSICIWKAKSFIKSYEQRGYAVFNGKIGFFPLNPLKTIKISNEEDFTLAEALLVYKKEGAL